MSGSPMSVRLSTSRRSRLRVAAAVGAGLLALTLASPASASASDPAPARAASASAAGSVAPVTAGVTKQAPVTWGFESDPVGAVPAGCSTPSGKVAASVTDVRAHAGSKSAELRDNSTTAQGVMVCATPSSAGADLRLSLYPEQLTNGVLVSLLGSFQGKPQTNTPVFHLLIRPDGGVSWYDGLGWTQIGAAGTVSVGAWNQLRVTVRPDMHQAALFAGDATLVGTAGPVGVSPVASVTGLQIASAGTASVGDTVYLDDVSVANGSKAPKPPRDRVFHLAGKVQVDSTPDSLMQMPNTATTVPTGAGHDEILVSYPVHGDATHATGTALASSTDNGRSWTRVDGRNPFPDDQSFYLSTLANGDLLAVLYHTFMVEGSGELQAEVPTAISHDGGRTWEHRDGRMTAPQPMRQISDATSRPGHRLGGFVLVHSVVEDADGTLLQSGYGFYQDDQKFRQILLASTDGGVNWTVRGTIAANPTGECFCEAGISRAADGSLLAVMRTGSYLPLVQSRSTDDGVTWTAPQTITVGPGNIPVGGVFPDLVLLDNGTLVLFVGRPGQTVLASTDGTGQHWTNETSIDYLNSGNGTLVPLGRNTILTFGDQGADWTPNAPTAKGIWARSIFVSPAGR